MSGVTPNTTPLFLNGTTVDLSQGTFAFPTGTEIDMPEMYPNGLPTIPNYIQPSSPSIPLNFGAVGVSGILDEDSSYPFQVIGTVSYDDVGKAVAVDFGQANAVRLAQPNDIILGQLLQVEYRSAYGIAGLVMATVQTEGGLRVPIDTTNVAAPVAPAAASLTAASGGALSAGTVFVKVAYVTGNGGITAASPESSIVVTANQEVLVASPPTISGVTGYNVYASTATGTEELQNAEPLPIGTTAVLTAVATGAAAAPTTSTATAVVAATVTIGGSVMGGFQPGYVQGLAASFARTNVVTNITLDSNGNPWATVLFL